MWNGKYQCCLYNYFGGEKFDDLVETDKVVRPPATGWKDEVHKTPPAGPGDGYLP